MVFARSPTVNDPARINLWSGSPFWLVKNGLEHPRTVLNTAEQADVVVIGAGITGALVADALVTAGLTVVILERREAGTGSTASSTALLQYEIDLELGELASKIGAEKANRAYTASLQAIRTLEGIARTLPDIDFETRCSLYLASTRRDSTRLQREVEMRSAIGIDVEWWPRERVEERYGFPSFGAIRNMHAAEVDALALTRALLRRAVSKGARLYEQTGVRGYLSHDAGVKLFTDNGMTVQARQAVCATGYDLPPFLEQDRVALHSTYALATHRLGDLGRWDDRCLIWESARPYCYMRTTADQRVIIGGEDVAFRNAAWRDRLLPQKVRRLEKRLRGLLPTVPTETAYEWAGTFAETPDGLPYIGRDERYPGMLFALGYGGNGITFSTIAAGLLTAECLGEPAPDADLFSMSR